jgi:hypothetical protein
LNGYAYMDSFCNDVCAKGWARLMPKPGTEQHVRSGPAGAPPPWFKARGWQMSRASAAKRRWLKAHQCE